MSEPWLSLPATMVQRLAPLCHFVRAKEAFYDGGVREPTLMRWPGQIPAGRVCREVAASVDLLPTLAYLSGAKLPTLPIDGYNIWPLMEGKPESKSPHDTYCLLHGPGTVRSGKWKYYPWQEGKHHEDRPVKIKNVFHPTGTTLRYGGRYW